MYMLQIRPKLNPEKKKRKIFIKEDAPLYLMALPTVIYLIIFCYLPMAGLIMAFQNLNITKGIFGSPLWDSKL